MAIYIYGLIWVVAVVSMFFCFIYLVMTINSSYWEDKTETIRCGKWANRFGITMIISLILLHVGIPFIL